MSSFYWSKKFLAGSVRLVAVALLLSAVAGCFTSGHNRVGRVDVKLPRWFTMPSGAEQKDTPVSMGIRLPQHLRGLAKEYGLPGWVVYGVVRCLGSDEFLANGKIKTFSVSDDDGEDSVVVDDVYYDVPEAEIRVLLAQIAAQCDEAENEIERQNILGNYVVRRFGAIVLFSLDRAGSSADNLLLSTGESNDPMEVFSNDEPDALPQVGWRETSSHYITTIPGTFMYGNPVLAFRLAEEDAIKDLAKTLLLKLSHMRKSVVEDIDGDSTDEVDEDVYCEEITLRMRGVRVLRRVVDMRHGLCLVEVSVPKNGVALH